MKVVLFDIDGTILHSGGAGRLAMIQAFEEMFGISNGFDGISMAGNTDPLIIKMALEKHDIENVEEKIDQFKLKYFVLLSENIKRNLPEKRIYPGVEIILEEMLEHSDIILGLLTGNWNEGAKIKLGHFDLYKYFPFGAFGSDAFDRNDLLPIALDRCSLCKNIGITAKDVIVIGDTPNDVKCAKVHGARALGVATGSFSKVFLKEVGADLAVQNLSDYKYILNWILN